ncbi:hypothetical protein LJE86_05005 [bacterium BMS3Abin03]|nr:hypothetical protein [bacterium BMS3Abin03]MCG6960601.1 hypothetical protein [bacterium BMS3Abin03]
MDSSKKYEKGHYWAIGFAIAFPICFTIGLILKRIEFGAAIGLLVGFSLGLILEKRYNKSPKELSEQEIKKRKFNALLLFGLATMTLIIVSLIYFLKK